MLLNLKFSEEEMINSNEKTLKVAIKEENNNMFAASPSYDKLILHARNNTAVVEKKHVLGFNKSFKLERTPEILGVSPSRSFASPQNRMS